MLCDYSLPLLTNASGEETNSQTATPTSTISSPPGNNNSDLHAKALKVIN
jgi:hypothetical protein